MAAEAYEVINHDEVTVHRTVSELRQPDGTVRYQNGMGRTYLLGEVIPAENVAEDWKQALEDEEGPLYESLKSKLRAVSDEPHEDLASRLGLPFEGYDDMDENDVVQAMKVLPSATIQRIKTYEESRDDPRDAIVNYSIGFGEHPDDRQNAEVEVEEVDTSKPVNRLTTREVPPSGPVRRGEGITGTGDPQKAYGSEKEAAEEGADKEKKKAPRTAKARGNVAAAKRRSRRERQPQPPKGSGEKGGSLETENTK